VKRILLIALTLVPVCFGALGTPIVTNNLTAPADWSYWFANGSMTETAAGLTSATNGWLIYGVTLPSNYEVRLNFRRP
jgi:L-lactate permease